jgi:hypothetical protein
MSSIFLTSDRSRESMPQLECSGVVRNLAIVLFTESANSADRKHALSQIETLAKSDESAAKVLEQFRASGLSVEERLTAPVERRNDLSGHVATER